MHSYSNVQRLPLPNDRQRVRNQLPAHPSPSHRRTLLRLLLLLRRRRRRRRRLLLLLHLLLLLLFFFFFFFFFVIYLTRHNITRTHIPHVMPFLHTRQLLARVPSGQTLQMEAK